MSRKAKTQKTAQSFPHLPDDPYKTVMAPPRLPFPYSMIHMISAMFKHWRTKLSSAPNKAKRKTKKVQT
jgi:hypothetical protein